MDIMRLCQINKLGKYVQGRVQHYNHEKYWRRRNKVINPEKKMFFLKLYYLYYIKKCDAFNNCSFGTNLNSGAFFAEPPYLPHGPNGIIVGHDCIIRGKITIYQQVTISQGGTEIGADSILGAGCKILSGRKIGNNVKVGANCVVIEDVPDNSTVVLPRPRIINRKK